ncbi:MAG: TetR/AcrR family transcriptional regulator [Thermodesulfovibrionales bacterium]
MKMIKNGSRLSGDIRKEQIVEAALKIIANRGVKSLTTAAIAEEVGISEANLYRHFNSKDEILQGTVEKIGEGLLGNLDAVSVMTNTSPLERLKRLFILHLDYIDRNEGIPRLVFSEEMHIGNENLKEKLLNTIGLYSARVESLIKEGQKAGLIRRDMEHSSAALMFIGMIQILTMKWSLSGFSFSLVDEGKKLWRNFEKCLSVK